MTQESIVTREEGVEDRCGRLCDESPPTPPPPPPYPLTTSRVTATSNFACELPSPPKKRKFVFRRIDKTTTQKRNDFYSDSSDVELDDIDTGHDIKLNHNALGSSSPVVDLSNLSDDDCEQNDMVNPGKHNGDNSMGGHRNETHQSERSNQIVQCISSDDDLSVDCHADAESVTDHCAVDSVYSDDHSKTNSLVIGSCLSHAMSSHCNSSSTLTDACDDLPDLNVDSGSCLLHVDSQTSTLSTITSQSQASVFSSVSVPTSYRSDLDSQGSEFSTAGCGRTLTKTSGNAKTMQVMK